MSAIDPDQQAAIEELIALINADAEQAAEEVTEFREAVAEAADELEDGDDLMWLLKDVIEWRSGFYVDWKDTESFVDSIDTLCEAWGVAVDWGIEDAEDDGDALDDTDVPSLMQQAHAALASQGLTLWNWATQGDCYSGWITQSDNDAKVRAIADRVQVEFRPGDHPF